MNPLVVPIVSELVIPMIKKLISKPKTGVKEASGMTMLYAAQQIYTQFSSCGLACVDPLAVGAFVSGLWVLAIRLHQKHSEEIKNKNVLK